MSDKKSSIFSGTARRKEINRAQESYNSTGQPRMVGGIEVVTPNPDAVVKRGLYKNYYKSDVNNKQTHDSILQQLLGGIKGNISHNIAMNVDTKTKYQNPAQLTLETYKSVGNKNAHLFAMDTEWIGGGDGMFSASPTEIGLSFGQQGKNGAVRVKGYEPGKVRGNKYTFAVQLDLNAANEVEKLLDKLNNHKIAGTTPNLSDAEFRTLRDLANYSDAQIGKNGLMTRGNTAASINKHNLMDYITQIQQGYNKLSPNNKQSRALKKDDLVGAINAVGGKEGFVFDNSAILVWQNGIKADLPVLNSAFGTTSQMGQILGGAKHVDTLSLIRTLYGDLLPKYNETVKGANTLDQAIKVFAKDPIIQNFMWHEAGDDALTTLHLYRGMKRDPEFRKKARMAKVSEARIETGSRLYSREAIPIRTPLDYVASPKNGELIQDDYYTYATSKRTEYRVINQYTKDLEGKRYYGVMLKNVDDGQVVSVARDSIDELQTLMQSSFGAYNPEAHGKEKVYRQYDKTARGYRNMFSGKGAHRHFERNLSALNFVAENGLYTEGSNGNPGSLHRDIVKKLMDGVGMTKNQAQTYANMHERLKTERLIFNKFNDKVLSVVGGEKRNDEKDIALYRFKQLMDEKVGAHTSVVSLPTNQRYGKLFNPFVNKWDTVEMADNAHMETYFRKTLNDRSVNPDMNIADMQARAETLIQDMVNRNMISKGKATNVIDKIYNVATPSGRKGEKLRGLQSITSLMTEELGGDIYKWNNKNGLFNKVDDQIRLDPRPNVIPADLLGQQDYTDLVKYSQNYFSSEGGIIEANLHNHLIKVDSHINAKINKHSSARTISALDSVQDMMKNWSSKGFAAEIRLSRGGRGMDVKLFDSKLATTSNVDMKNAVNFTLPLVDLETGLFDFNNIKLVNPMNARYKKTKGRAGAEVMVETFQNKVFNLMGYDKTLQTIQDHMREGNYRGAQTYINKVLNNGMQAIPAGSNYGYDKTDQLHGSSKTYNSAREGLIYIDDLTRDVARYRNDVNLRDLTNFSVYNKKTGGKLTEKNFREQLLYGEAAGEKLDPLVQTVVTSLNKAFSTHGWSISNIQSGNFERAVNSNYSDVRNFGFHGEFADVGRENMRQMQNRYDYSLQDKMLENGKLTTREEVIRKQIASGKLSQSEAVRLFSPYVVPERFHESVQDKALGGLNLKVAFMDTKQITDVLQGPNQDENALARALKFVHTNDDAMVMTASKAKMFDLTEEHFEKLDKGSKIDGTLASAYNKMKTGEGDNVIFRRGDVIGKKLVGREWKDITYDSEYDGVLEDIRWNQDKNIYELQMQKVKTGADGMKVGDILGGQKGTIRIISDQLASQAGLEDIDALMHFSGTKVKSMPGGIMASQVQTYMDHMNEQYIKRQVTKQQLEEQVNHYLQTVYGSEKIAKQFRLREIETLGQTVFSLISPTKIDANLKLNDFINTTAQFTGGKNKHGDILTGIMQVGRLQTAEDYKIVGDDGSGYKMGWRDLQFLEFKKQYNPKDAQLTGAIDTIVGNLSSRLRDGNTEHWSDAKSIFEVLTDATGKSKGNYNIVSLTENAGEGNKYIGDLRLLPTQTNSGTYSPMQVKGTILDKDLFDGKSFHLQLPFEVDVNGSKVSKLLMPATNMTNFEGGYMPTKLQGLGSQIFDTVNTIMSNSTYKDGSTAEEINATKKMVSDAREKLMGTDDRKGLVEKYLTEAYDSTFSSKGEIYEKGMKKRFEHSGRFTLQGLNPNTYQDLGLQENTVLVSRDSFSRMINGVDDDTAKLLTELAQGNSGVNVLGTRFPVHHEGAVQGAKVRIFDEATEARLADEGLNLKGNAYVTHGTQVRWNGDFDGDKLSLFFAQLQNGGINKNVDSAMEVLYRNESALSNRIANKLVPKIQKEAEYIYDSIGGDELSPKTLERTDAGGNTRKEFVQSTAARLEKEVGVMSNLNLRYSRVAQMMGDQDIMSIWEAVGSSVEQAPISSKKLGEETAGWTAQEILDRKIRSSGRLRESMESWDVDKMMESMKEVGFFNQDEETGDWMFSGAKDEALKLEARTGKQLSLDEVRSAIEKMKDFGEGNSKLGRLGMNKANNFGYVQDFLDELLEPSVTSAPVTGWTGFDEHLKYIGMGASAQVHQETREISAKIVENSRGIDPESKVNLGRILTEDDFADNSITTFGQKVIGGMAEAGGGNLLGKAGLVAAGAGALWLGGSVLGGGPNVHRKTQQGRHDQAQSADGEYVDYDPSMFEGAPIGSEPPTARLMSMQQGTRLKLDISGKVQQGMDYNQIASVIANEVSSQTGMQMNINVVARDDRKSFDKSWLQDEFSSAVKSERA